MSAAPPPQAGHPSEKPAPSAGIRLMMRRIFAVALNTFREAVRNRVLAILFLFALGMMSFSLVLGELSIHEEVRIIKDLGLAGISLFGLAIALFLGVNLLAKELEKKTVYAVLPKPIRRWEFLVGKYLGLVATITVVVVLMSLFVAAMLLFEGAAVDSVFVRAEVLVWLELMLVVAVAMVFNSFSSPYLSAMFTAALWVIGRNTGELEAFATTKLKGQPVGMLLEWVVRIVPDFRMFFVSGANLGGDGILSIHERFVTWGYVASAGGYAALYVVTCLVAASLLFERRDFT